MPSRTGEIKRGKFYKFLDQKKEVVPQRFFLVEELSHDENGAVKILRGRLVSIGRGCVEIYILDAYPDNVSEEPLEAEEVNALIVNLVAAVKSLHKP